MKDEIFDIVDEKGNFIDTAARTVCHNGSKLLHPVIHLHIFNSKNELLLQKRSKNKDIQPGKWDTSVGGHIDSGEKAEVALKREAFEELGIIIDPDKIKFISEYIFESDIEREFVYSYIYKYDGEIKFSKMEIDEVNFYNIDEIKKLIMKNETTINFIKEFSLIIDFMCTG